MKNLRILALGDIVGPRSVEYLRKNLWKIRNKHKIDFVVANGENSSEPNGIDKSTAGVLFDSGIDVITTGNHVWRKSTVFEYLDDEELILRPLNYPSENPGHGDVIAKVNGYSVLVMNVMGQAYMDVAASPFESVRACLDRNRGKYDFAILDIHAEATGEKKAIAYDFCKEISVIYGTHTHVQTNDAQILEGSCGYITDLGMCGDNDSILGVDKEPVIHKMKTKMLSKFTFAKDGQIQCDGGIFEVNTSTFKCEKCEIIRFTGDIV